MLERVDLCDTWGGEYGGSNRNTHAHIMAVLLACGYKHVIEFHDGDSKTTVPKIGCKFDMILVDGDHSRDGVTADLENVLPLLAPGGKIVVDDTAHPAHPDILPATMDFVARHEDKISLESINDNYSGTAVLRSVVTLKKAVARGRVEHLEDL